MVSLDLTIREIEVIRQALRSQEDTHRRGDFKGLVEEDANLRAKISDALLDFLRVKA